MSNDSYGNQPPGNQPPPPGNQPPGNQPPPPGYGPPNQYYQQKPAGSGLAITALILGILALLTSWTVVGGILLGLGALIVGFIASGKAKRGQAGGRGMAITGIVLGFLGVIIAVVVIVAGVAFFNSDSGQNLQDCLRDAGDDQSAIEECERDLEEDLLGG